MSPTAELRACLDCGKPQSEPGVPAICAAWHGAGPATAATVRMGFTVRVTRDDGVVIFDGAITGNDRFTMEQAEGKSTTVSLTATAAIEGLLS